MKILITGIAGFIGFHAAKKLITNYDIIGIDNLNDYYDVELKKARLNELLELGLEFKNLDITNTKNILDYFKLNKPTHVLHLAAQAGVRYSLENPHTYATTNICGFLNILEGCRYNNIAHLIYASSSSVYGLNKDNLFSEKDYTDHPSSLYAASKKSNELMAHSYSHLFDLPTTGLRFFTVYGPYGRPDMALYIFVKNILNEMPINVHGHGKMLRDFTYIDDIINGIVKIIPSEPSKQPLGFNNKDNVSLSSAPWSIINIGNNNPVKLSYFIELIEKNLNKKALKKYIDFQPGDVIATAADITKINTQFDFIPKTKIEEGIPKFINWYKSFYNIQ
jgi:UDP-glucuronate 4-epimerase